MPSPSFQSSFLLLWCVAGALALFPWIGVSALSAQFVFGGEHADRPVIALLTLYLSAWLGFALAAYLAFRSGCNSLSFVLTIAFLARLILMPSNPILENDCYRYVLDGEAVVYGVNPYAYAPEDVPQDAPDRFRERLAGNDAQLVLSRVGHPDVPTIYPPAAQGAFAIGVLMTPWSWMGQRIVFLLADLATIGLLLLLLRAAGRPLTWIVFYAWNPLVLKETVNSVHVDGVVAFWLVLTIAGLVKVQDPRGLRWACLCGFTLAGAILTKLYPIVLVPICLAFVYRGSRRLPMAAVFIGSLAVTLVASYVPFAGVGWEQLTAGLRTYLREWQRNEGAFALLDLILPWPRPVAAGIAAAAVAWATVFVHRSNGNHERLIAAFQVSLLTWLLFLPAVYPWYTLTLLAVTVLRPRPWAVVLSGFLGLYYLHFWIDYQNLPAGWHTGVQLVEHGAIWATLAISFWMAKRNKRATCTV